MLFLRVLLLFVLFGSSAATGKNQRHRGASASSQPSDAESEIKLGVIYWMTLTQFGAKGSRSDRVFRPVIPVGKVPLEYTKNVDHGLYFVADLWHHLPLEDKYTEDTTTYFYESDRTMFHSTEVSLRHQSINKEWARIAKGKVLKRAPPKGKGPGGKIRYPEKITKIYENMLQNFKGRINSESLKLNLAVDGLGQTFEPYIELGVVYWMKPTFLGSPDESGSKADHPVIPVRRVNDPKNPGRDLFFLSQLSGYLPLKSEYKAKAGAYLEPNSGKQFKNNEMNIGWAQVALGESFCYGRHIGDGKDVHMKKDKMDMIYKNMQTNYNERVGSGRLKLDFNKDDLNQYDPTGFTSTGKGKGTPDFFVALGHVYWVKSYRGHSRYTIHPVVPVGKVPNSLDERYFVAELSAVTPPWKGYWESAAEYFSEKEIVTDGQVIIPGKWLINTSWAVEVQKKWLHRCAGKGRNAQMLKDKMNKILDNMLTNSRERRQKGVTDFFLTDEPAVGEASGQHRLSGQDWRLPERPSDKSRKTIGESSKS